ncbi:MAG TPA: hypothetical protein VJ732_19530 [Bryobacteraceae bacterium]|nr:hypothetical protein [Bryobacteraceae bacterium]
MSAPVSPEIRSSELHGVPWYIWCSVAAVTSAMIGVHWDVSWHRSIGRDTFWTPAHMAIHLCGVLAGAACGYLILATSFARDSTLRPYSVNIWGFRGPLGAFISAWGGIAMLTSAPFDNWWHNAYGLDVTILSPPHMVLAAGIIAVHVGTLTLILAYMNRAADADRRALERLFLYVGGMILVCLTVVELEITSRTSMHTAHFYRVVATAAPVVLAGVARAARWKWAASAVAGVYTVFVLLMSWILPLFPAEPKLGPVYYPLTQFTPPEFPLLVLIPALALDLFWQRTPHWRAWRQSLAAGLLFLGVFAAVQWPFADFLMSPPARNWFFGAKYFGYYTSPRSLYARYLFARTETGGALLAECALAIAISVLTIRAGLDWGNWMRRIRR